jgi:NADH-quinone oxidoreductase subunit M
MILVCLIIILLSGGILALIVSKWNPSLCRIISLAAIIVDLLILINLFYIKPLTGDRIWIMEYSTTWIKHFGISLHLAIDGLSLLLLLLTFFLGSLAVLISWREIDERPGFFHFNLLWTLAGITGVFMSLDMFLFYFLSSGHIFSTSQSQKNITI